MVCGRVTHCNGTHGMQVDDSLQRHAWYAGALTHCNGTHDIRVGDSPEMVR